MLKSSRSAIFLRRGWLSCRVESAVLFSRSLSEAPFIFNNKLHFALAKGSSQCLVEHLSARKRAPFRLSAGYMLEAGGFLPAIIATIHPTNKYHRVMRSQAFHKRDGALSRTPLNLPVAHFSCFPDFGSPVDGLCVCVCVFTKLHIIVLRNLALSSSSFVSTRSVPPKRRPVVLFTETSYHSSYLCPGLLSSQFLSVPWLPFYYCPSLLGRHLMNRNFLVYVFFYVLPSFPRSHIAS